MSQASCSWPTSHSSLTRRSSDSTRSRARRSRPSSAAPGASTPASTPRSTRVLPEPRRARRAGRRCAGTSRPRESEISLQRGTPARPQLAVHAVAEELVGVARRPRARVQHRLAVLDHEHGVAGLVARTGGCARSTAGTGSRCRWSAPCSCRRAPPAARRGSLGQPLAARCAAQSATGCGGEVELAVAPAGAHEGGVRLGHGLVVASAVIRGCSARVLCSASYVGVHGSARLLIGCGVTWTVDDALDGRRRHGRLPPQATRAPPAIPPAVRSRVRWWPSSRSWSRWRCSVGASSWRSCCSPPARRTRSAVGLAAGAAARRTAGRLLPLARPLRARAGAAAGVAFGWGALVATAAALLLQAADRRAARRVGDGLVRPSWSRPSPRRPAKGALRPAAAVVAAARDRRGARRPGVRRAGRRRLRVHREHPLLRRCLHR